MRSGNGTGTIITVTRDETCHPPRRRTPRNRCYSTSSAVDSTRILSRIGVLGVITRGLELNRDNHEQPRTNTSRTKPCWFRMINDMDSAAITLPRNVLWHPDINWFICTCDNYNCTWNRCQVTAIGLEELARENPLSRRLNVI